MTQDLDLDALIDRLRQIDSPTVANAIEVVHSRDRCDGYLGGEIRCFTPTLGSMVGRALTVTMTSKRGPTASQENRRLLWRELESLRGPTVVVVHDASETPTRYAVFGEVMSAIASRLGTVGIVTDAGIRDILEVRSRGIHYFGAHAVVSHGNFEIADIGQPVELYGERIETGDLLHGDLNGIVVIPDEVLAVLPDAIGQVRSREERILSYVDGPEFTLSGLQAVGGY